MIAITCDKCGKVSESSFPFGRKRFYFTNERHYLRRRHLCSSCQLLLRERINETVAVFLGVEEVNRWVEVKGVIE